MSRPTYTIRDDQASVAVQLGRWIAELTEERDRLLAENAAMRADIIGVFSAQADEGSMSRIFHEAIKALRKWVG